MELKKEAGKREQLLGLLCIVGLFVLFFRVIYLPRKIDSENLSVREKNLKMEKKSLEQLTEILKKRVPEAGKGIALGRLEVKMEILRGKKDPISQVTSDLLSHLTAKTILKGVKVREMSELPVVQAPGYQKSNFTIHAEGSFGSITKYLYRVEDIPALLAIDNIGLKAVSLKSSIVTLEMDGTLYRLGG